MADYQALSVPPSTNWAGNDGTWSTFSLTLGSNDVQIELLPATSTGAIWAVTPDGCPYNQPYTETECQTLRGGVYDYNQSDTFSYYTGKYVPFGLSFFAEETLGPPYSTSGDSQAAIDVLDDAVLGQTHVYNQFIETYTSTFPYVGLLGLTNRGNNISTTAHVYPSMLGTLSERSSGTRISPYWAYTAGSYNYQTPYLGSLTFGGYDAARGNTKNVLTVPLGALPTRDTSVKLANITITSANGQQIALGQNLDLFMYIDSVVPEIWLPPSACSVFESAFGITYDDNLSLYMINDTQHNKLLQLNATVELALTAGSESIIISIPYLAFHQRISYPLAGITDQSVQYYFPLRQASDDPSDFQYILGRVFLQAAYIAVDYNRTEFYISQAQFPEDSSETNITTVYPMGVQNPNAITTTTPFPSPHSLDTADIAGIVVGVIGAITILLVLLWWFFRRRRAEKQKQEAIRQMSEVNPASRGGKDDFVGYYGGSGETKDAEDETYEKRELDANATSRPSIAYEMPSPPLPQYSPGSRSPGSPGSPHSQHVRNISAESSELPADYLTAGGMSLVRVPGGPWELQGDNQQPGSVSPPLEMGIGSVRGPGEHARPVSPIELSTGTRRTLDPSTNF